MAVNYNILNKISEKNNLYYYIYIRRDTHRSDCIIYPRFVNANNKEEAYLKIFSDGDEKIRCEWINTYMYILIDKYKDNIIKLIKEKCSNEQDMVFKYLDKLMIEKRAPYKEIEKIIPNKDELNKLILEYMESLVKNYDYLSDNGDKKKLSSVFTSFGGGFGSFILVDKVKN